jgi:hypothetical protein
MVTKWSAWLSWDRLSFSSSLIPGRRAPCAQKRLISTMEGLEFCSNFCPSLVLKRLLGLRPLALASEFLDIRLITGIAACGTSRLPQRRRNQVFWKNLVSGAVKVQIRALEEIKGYRSAINLSHTTSPYLHTTYSCIPNSRRVGQRRGRHNPPPRLKTYLCHSPTPPGMDHYHTLLSPL